MKVLMRLDARAILEWNSTRGLVGLTYTEAETKSTRFTVVPGADEDDRLEGTLDELLIQAEDLVERKKMGEAFPKHIENVCETLLAQPLPTMEVSKTDLDLEAQRVRDCRREWLIRQIEDGSYAAIQMLKDEFGETVRISVEVLA